MKTQVAERQANKFESEIVLDKIFQKYQQLYDFEADERDLDPDLRMKVNGEYKYGYTLSLLHSIMHQRLTEEQRQQEVELLHRILKQIQKKIDRQKRINKKLGIGG